MQNREADLKRLMLAGQEGDAGAYRSLLDRLGAHLRAYYKGKLGRISRSAAEAEDLVQEALIAIHLKRHTYSPAEPFTPWAHAIARYKLIDHLRKTKASMRDVPIEDADELVARDDHADADSSRDIERLMALLPTRMRQVLWSVKIDGLNTQETAVRFKMSESYVKVTVYRGLQRLKKFVGQGKAL